jgi:hypothetical protein
LFLSLPGRAHTSATASPSLLPLSPSLLLGGRSTEPHREGGARWDGRASQAARTPRDRSALTRESNPARTGKYPFYPAPHTPLHLSLRKGGSGAASAARAVQAGAAWGFRFAVAVPGFKSEGGRQRARRPSYQPHWGFPFPLLLRDRREREEEGGVATAPGRGGTWPHRNTDDAPGEERATAAPHRERKEPGTRSRERGAGSTDRSCGRRSLA